MTIHPRGRIFDALLQSVPDDAVVTGVAVGIFWTCVRTQYGCSLSATAHRWCDDPPGALIPGAGNLIGMSVRELASLYDSPSLSARAVANAAVGACCDPDVMTGGRVPGNGQDLIFRWTTPGRSVALVGHFHFADELRAAGLDLDVYEMPDRCGPGDIPNTRIPELLPRAGIVVMTSSTLITHATEDIISHAAPDARKMIVGPTVPIHPILWDFGIDAVCGSIVRDPVRALAAVSQGANHRQIPSCEKVNFLRSGLGI